eukprot:6182566-Pleurochrysis_carterae.AAC.1
MPQPARPAPPSARKRRRAGSGRIKQQADKPKVAIIRRRFLGTRFAAPAKCMPCLAANND